MGSEHSCMSDIKMRQSTPFESMKPTLLGRHRPVVETPKAKPNHVKALQSPEILGFLDHEDLREFVSHPIIMHVLEEKERTFGLLEKKFAEKKRRLEEDFIQRNFKKTNVKNFDLVYSSKNSRDSGSSGNSARTTTRSNLSYNGSSRVIKTPLKPSGFRLKSKTANYISKGYKSHTVSRLEKSEGKDPSDASVSKINPFVLGSEVEDTSQESTQMQTFYSKQKKRMKCQEIADFKNLIHRKLNGVSEEKGLVELFKKLNSIKKMPYVLKTGGSQIYLKIYNIYEWE